MRRGKTKVQKAIDLMAVARLTGDDRSCWTWRKNEGEVKDVNESENQRRMNSKRLVERLERDPSGWFGARLANDSLLLGRNG